MEIDASFVCTVCNCFAGCSVVLSNFCWYELLLMADIVVCSFIIIVHVVILFYFSRLQNIILLIIRAECHVFCAK